MGKSNRFAFVYLIIGVVFLLGWPYVQNAIWPPPPKQNPLKPEDGLALFGGNLPLKALEVGAPELAVVERKAQFPSVVGAAGGSMVTTAIQAEVPALVAAERRKELAKKAAPSELIAMGRGPRPSHLQVLLNTQGGSIQQVIVTDFQEADREGLPVQNADGSKKPLHLIPGVRVPRTEKMRDQRNVPVPELAPGPIKLDPAEIEHPSYVMYHYEKDSDPQPVDTLGKREWRVVANWTTSDGSSQTVAFETELGAPFYVKITKTYTLRRDEYHVGLAVTIAPSADRPAGFKPEPFRYQIDGPRGTPVEGEWYSSTYRQGVVGWADTRALEYAQDVRFKEGSERHISKSDRPILYAGIMIQYFASVLALDNDQPAGQARDYIEAVRFTPVGDERHRPGHPFLTDITFRAISRPLVVADAVTHPYVLYQGPVKVRLLKQLEGEQAVPEEIVNKYRDDLHLNTLTDAPMSNWLGRFANFIFWTDIVIAFTNLIHSLLGLLSQVVPNVGICIILITFMVRGLLHPFSRRQMINAKKMQAKQEKLAPELKKLTEKYGDDFNRLNAEKMKLYREHGINPAAAMGGCFLLLAQMPIFMGLYYALQESVFFRLEPFLWITNLAAPDMLLWWTEDIPFISKPEDMGGMIYLGPYLNLLPLIAVGLMMYVQSKMMPKSEDPQIQMQQKTMKIMMVLFAFFFYKVAAGLCIYFICSSLWGMVERKLLPKKVDVPDEPKGSDGGPGGKDRDKPTAPKGWMGRKMAGWREKWDKILEEAQKQQQLQREQRGDQVPRAAGPTPGVPPPGPGQRPGKRKKRKR
jgi:YidC/Oxa1 family membrane protein insertase